MERTISWIVSNQTILSVITNILLVIVTLVYAVLTRSLVKLAEKQVKVVSNPILGIKITKMYISKVYGPERRTLTVEIEVANIGDGPAINIQIDGEIILKNNDINGKKVIPAYTEPRRLTFLMAGQKWDNNFESNVYFGNKAILYLFDDLREASRLNEHRIKTKSNDEVFEASKIRILVYYSNNLGQQFRSSFETYVDLGMEMKEDPEAKSVTIKPKEIPTDGQEFELTYHPYIRPEFESRLIEKKEVAEELAERNLNRKLSGW
ncbi:hypothetical protein [Desulfitobacterium metallireducens]|uniref:Uncharacterized protein n=1 Tax=Desulfitobacterium metallireducens DSM 15288 TaxID=871968 RepID=W0EFT8_9FIRM|nr:hypothetical protein [Desulfitobacterium metallireducens]AHF08378.1 hypothetical protein DESME_01090 [Desulfitobacterium metallireducens DSM 15288]